MLQFGSKTKVAVVGAGPGGLAAAMLLSAEGYEVDLYESQPVVGGRSARLSLGNYKFDRGATFLMMPQLLEELFQLAGRELSSYVNMHKLDPLYSLHFGDTTFTPSTDKDRTAAEIERLFPGDGEGYLRFMREEEDKFGRIMPLLQRPFGKLRDYARRDILHALPRLHVTDTVYGRLSRYFKDERLRHAFTFQAKYLGMSPWECPGTFTILSFLEHRYGLYHPEGGVNRVLEAMASVIRENGGSIRLSCGVERILVERGRAVGVKLQDGSRETADHVVIGADFGTAMERLFEPGVLKRYTPDKLARKRYSLSTAMLYLGVEGEVDLAHHSVHFAADYRRNVEDITQRGTLSEDPSVYVHNPSALDPTLAPEGHTALYALMPVPNLAVGSLDWERDRERLQQSMMDRLRRIPALKDLPDRIQESLFYTPLDWRDHMGVYNGATFNLAHNVGQMMYRRPHNRFEEVEGVWLVGGGTHPGSGLPTIFESAKISVALLQEQDRARRPKISAAATPSAGVPS